MFTAAHASLIVSEPFSVGTGTGDYANDTSIAGQGHGTGFGSSTWNTSTDNQNGIWKTQSGGLASPYLSNTQDGFLEFTRESTGTFLGTASRTITVGALSETSYYMSALLQISQWSHETRIDIGFGGTNPMSFGITAAGNPGIGGGGLHSVNTEIDLVAGETYLFVVKLTEGGSNDDQWLWINPSTSAEPDAGSAALFRGTGSRMGPTDNQPRSLTLNLTRDPAVIHAFDELRIATSWEGLGIIPEPSTYALIAGVFGLMAVVIKRRLRAAH